MINYMSYEMIKSRGATQAIRFISRPSGGEIYTVLTLPVDNFQPSQLALICPPIFGEYSNSYAILRELAQQLSAHGIGVLRFDYVGVGESYGDPDTFSMSSAVADISFLASWLMERFPAATKVTPIGMRLGCRLMLDALVNPIRSGSPRIAMPILWDPVLDTRQYILGELRNTLAGAMVIYRSVVASREDIVRETLESGFCEREGYRLNQIDGYPITREFLREAWVGSSNNTWSFLEPVVVLVTVSAGNAERQHKQLASMLLEMKFHAVQDVPYWNLTPTYSQIRENLFGVTQRCMEQCD